MELSLVGQHLLDEAHQEFASDTFQTVPVIIEWRACFQARSRF